MDWRGVPPPNESLHEDEPSEEARFFVRVLVWMRWSFWAAIALTAMGAWSALQRPDSDARAFWTLAFYVDVRHALVVDDESRSREVLRRALQAEGWQVAEAPDGRAALGEVTRRRPSLVLLDLMMPVMDGFDFVAEMRARDEVAELES